MMSRRYERGSRDDPIARAASPSSASAWVVGSRSPWPPGHGFAAAGVNYGAIQAKPLSALRDACPVVASYGARDRSLKGAAARLDGILTALEIDHDVKEYPDAGHSFMNDHRDEKTPWVFAVMGPLTGGIDFVEPSAIDPRGRIVAFFERHLEGGA